MAWVCGADRDLPISGDTEWDGDAAKAGIFAWAGFDDDNPQSSKARRGFLLYESDEPDLRGSYHLPFAHITGGELKASPAGLRAAASRLPQTDAPQAALDRARAVIDHYQARMEENHWPRSQRTRIAASAFVTKDAELVLDENQRTARFVASSNSIDRYGDIVEQEWELTDFWRNPAFLWAHNSWDLPIGWVREFDTTPDHSRTIARVEFLPPGVDDFADKLCRMVQLKALRAVSVGFQPIETEDRLDDRGRWDGYRFMRNKLIELSLCTIPANQDAISLARSIDGHPAFLRRVFAEGIFRASADPQLAPQHVGRFPLRDRHLAELARRHIAA